MSLDLLRQTSGRSAVLDRRVVSPASTQRRVGGSSIANEAFLRGECGEDGWVTCGGKAPLSQWFSAGVVLSSTSSLGSILSVWVRALLISHSRWYLLLQPRASIVGFGCVPQVMACWPSSWASFWTTRHIMSCRHSLQNCPPTWRHCSARFEFILLLLMGAGATVLEELVLVSAWYARTAPTQDSKAGHPDLSVMTGCVNYGFYGWNMTWWETWQSIGAALVASVMFQFTFLVSLGAVGACGRPLCGGVRVGLLLPQSSEGT